MRWLFVWMALFQLQAQVRELPHYTREGGGFHTDLILVNPDFEASHTVRLLPMGDSGPLPEAHNREISVPAGARLTLDRTALGWVSQPVSHVRIEGDSQVRVSASIHHQQAESLPVEILESSPLGQIRLIPALRSGWFDGLVLVNPDAQAVTARASSHDAAGNTLHSRDIQIPASGKWQGLLSELFPQLDGSGYVEIRGNLVYQALRGSLSGSPAVLTPVGFDALPSTPAKLSYSNQISRIIRNNCETCHRQSGIAPFPLSTHSQVLAQAFAIPYQLQTGTMPPWKAAPNCGEFVEDLTMDPAERALFLDWLQADRAIGESERLPAPTTYPDGEWLLGEPDFIAAYPTAFEFPGGQEEYRCFPIELKNASALQLSAIEVLPGNLQSVHHVLVFAETSTTSLELDAQQDGPGYTCFGGTGTGGFRLLAGWAPGVTPYVLPDDITFTLRPNTLLIIQVHYSSHASSGDHNHKTDPILDQTKIGLHFSPTFRSKELQLLPLVNQDFTIPAGALDYPVERSVTVPSFLYADLYSVAPHMHLLGRSIHAWLSYSDGSEECLIDVPDWDFNWQRVYLYKQPIHIPGGTTIHFRALYDNTESNTRNPNSPPRDVSWGEATTDEMALVFMGVVAPIQLVKSF